MGIITGMIRRDEDIKTIQVIVMTIFKLSFINGGLIAVPINVPVHRKHLLRFWRNIVMLSTTLHCVNPLWKDQDKIKQLNFITNQTNFMWTKNSRKKSQLAIILTFPQWLPRTSREGVSMNQNACNKIRFNITWCYSSKTILE